MRHSPGISLLGVALLVGAGACSSKPEEQKGLAQKAMDQAKEQRASEFASSEWRSAQQAWDQAHSAYQRERYGEAGSLFLTAKSRFERARNVAKAARDVVLRETQNTQKTIELRYKALKASLEAGGLQLAAATRKALDESCKEIDRAIERLETEIEQGDYSAARTTATGTMRQVYEAEKTLERPGARPKKAS